MDKFFDSLGEICFCWLLAIIGISFSFSYFPILMIMGFIFWGASAILMFIGIIIEADKND